MIPKVSSSTIYLPSERKELDEEKLNSPTNSMQIDSAIIKTSHKVKKVYGFAALAQIGCHSGDCKYRIEEGQLIRMSSKDYTYRVFGFEVNTLPFLRKYYGASYEDLNFLDEEIPKYIRWYLWDDHFKSEAKKFLENVVLRGLASLKDVTYKDNPPAIQDLEYRIQLIKLATQEPINKETLLQNLMANSVSKDRALKTLKFLHHVDTNFGASVQLIVTFEKLKKLNEIFAKYNTNAKKRNEKDALELEASIDSFYKKYIGLRNAVITESVPQGLCNLQQNYRNLTSPSINIIIPAKKEEMQSPKGSKPNSVENVFPLDLEIEVNPEKDEKLEIEVNPEKEKLVQEERDVKQN
jgi:hypothetical protein